MEQTSGLGTSHIHLNLGESNEKLVLYTQISPLLNHQYPLLACMKKNISYLPTEPLLLKTSTHNLPGMLLIISLVFHTAK